MHAHCSTNFEIIQYIHTYHLLRGPGAQRCFHRVRDETTNEGGRRRTHLSSRNLPSTERNVGNLTSAENQELDGGRADGRKGDRGTTSGNLRGIEDLVHSYPPTSRPRPAESSLGLNAPIPFSWPLSAYPCTRHTLHIYVHGASFTLHAGVFTIYSAPRVGNAVGYLVDIVYLGYSPPHEPRDFSFRLSSRRPWRRSVNETIA